MTGMKEEEEVVVAVVTTWPIEVERRGKEGELVPTPSRASDFPRAVTASGEDEGVVCPGWGVELKSPGEEMGDVEEIAKGEWAGVGVLFGGVRPLVDVGVNERDVTAFDVEEGSVPFLDSCVPAAEASVLRMPGRVPVHERKQLGESSAFQFIFLLSLSKA